MGINQREMIPWGGDKKPTGFYCTKTNCFVLPVKRKKNQRLKISFTFKSTMYGTFAFLCQNYPYIEC